MEYKSMSRLITQGRIFTGGVNFGAIVFIVILVSCARTKTVSSPYQYRPVNLHPEKVLACLSSIGAVSGRAEKQVQWDSVFTVEEAIGCIEAIEGPSADTMFMDGPIFKIPAAVALDNGFNDRYSIWFDLLPGQFRHGGETEELKSQILGQRVYLIEISRYGPDGYIRTQEVFSAQNHN